MPGGLKWDATVWAGWATGGGELQRLFGKGEGRGNGEGDAQNVWTVWRIVDWWRRV